MSEDFNLPAAQLNRLKSAAGAVYNHQLFFDGIACKAGAPPFNRLTAPGDQPDVAVGQLGHLEGKVLLHTEPPLRMVSQYMSGKEVRCCRQGCLPI